jgi:hypothetical protein
LHPKNVVLASVAHSLPKYLRHLRFDSKICDGFVFRAMKYFKIDHLMVQKQHITTKLRNELSRTFSLASYEILVVSHPS